MIINAVSCEFWQLTLPIAAAATLKQVFDNLLTTALYCLSHRPRLGGYDQPQMLCYQIVLCGPIGANVRQHIDIGHSAAQKSLSGASANWHYLPATHA